MNITDKLSIANWLLTENISSIKSEEDKFELGKPYVIQTVTAFYKGVLTHVDDKEFTLVDCSWVADTGRFNEFVNDDSKVNEEEPFAKETKVYIGRGALVCMYRIPTISRKLK